ERNRAAERVDPILEPNHSGPATRVGAADAVIPDLELERPVAPPTEHRDRRCLRMLDGVRDRLCRHEVDGGLECRVVPALEVDVEVDPNRTPPCESVECVVETGVGEDRRMDAA